MAISIDPYASVTLDEAVEIIKATGTFLTCIMQGETGIGKSYTLKKLSKEFPNHTPIYLDCTTKEAGDLAMPKIYVSGADGVGDRLDFVPSKELGLYLDKPVLVMIDEIGKATRPIQNVLCRYIYERRIGEYALHPESIVFATTNLQEEGFQDNTPAYMRNRSMFITVRKPNAQEWIENFALPNDLHPTVIATVSEHPAMLDSWMDTDSAGGNEYVFDPRSPQQLQQFCTPRSLAGCDPILRTTGHLPSSVRTHMLAGQIGKAGAMTMMAMHDLHADLPAYQEVVKAPSTAKVPSKSAAVCLFVYTLLSNIEKDHTDAVVTYLKRLPREQQALFTDGLLKHKKAPLITAAPTFITFAKELGYLYQKN